MKKTLAIMGMAIMLATMVFAARQPITHIHTIELISVVEETQPQFAIRNTQTGETGSTVIYSTNAITRTNVSTGFQIIQTNESNYRGTVFFEVEATELMAMHNGKFYSTQGVQITMNGCRCGNYATMALEYNQNFNAGTVINTFNVTWQGNAALAQTTYEAAVTLTYTAA